MQDVGFLTEEWFWGAIAALAATIGAFFSWLIATIIKRREQPEADWAVTMGGYATLEDQRGEDPGFHLTGRISNVGDGAAFHVQLEPRNCSASFYAKDTQGMPAMAHMPPGSVASFSITVDLDRWDDADIDIVWTAPPTRLKKKKRSPLNPRDFMEAPGVTYTDPLSGKVSQRSVAFVRAQGSSPS